MSTQRDLELRVSEWLEGEAGGELPDWILEEAFRQTRAEQQQVTFRARLRSLRPAARRDHEPPARRGFTMFTSIRAAAIAVLIGIVGLGAALVGTVERTAPTSPAAETLGAIEPTELLDLTFDGGIIPEEFVGVLFSRKTYPTDKEIEYTPAFLPPNTFIRFVEAGELGIRPNDDTQIIRAGQTQEDADVVKAGEEAIISAGDILIQRDVPWQEFGEHALGEMWTPGEDAAIFSLAIREQERCCAMSHQGMDSRWYHTLTSGVQELSEAPMRFRVQRWEIPVGDSLTQPTATVPSLWAVDTGKVVPIPEADLVAEVSPTPRPVAANEPIWAMAILEDTMMVLQNVGDETAVLYQLIVEPAEAA